MVDNKEKCKRMGRPLKAQAERRSVMLTLRLTHEERALLRSEAKKRHVSVADLLLSPWRFGKEK